MIRHTDASAIVPARIVVLGGSGFIGSHLVAHFATAGVETVAVSSTSIDLAGPRAVEALADKVRKDDTVIFASCITRDKGEDIPTLMKNLAMAQNVALFLEQHGARHLIYLSSDAIYSDGLALVNEDSPSQPAGLYGATHWMRERMVAHSAGKAGTPLAVLRPCGVYGPGDTHNGYGPNRFLRTALADGRIVVFGQGEETRDHIFVGDVCRLIDLCARHRDTGILNLATGQAHSFGEVAAVVASVVDRDVQIENRPRQTPVTHRHFDVTATFKAYPTFAFVPLEHGLSQTVEAIARA